MGYISCHSSLLNGWKHERATAEQGGGTMTQRCDLELPSSTPKPHGVRVTGNRTRCVCDLVLTSPQTRLLTPTLIHPDCTRSQVPLVCPLRLVTSSSAFPCSGPTLCPPSPTCCFCSHSLRVLRVCVFIPSALSQACQQEGTCVRVSALGLVARWRPLWPGELTTGTQSSADLMLGRFPFQNPHSVGTY